MAVAKGTELRWREISCYGGQTHASFNAVDCNPKSILEEFNSHLMALGWVFISQYLVPVCLSFRRLLFSKSRGWKDVAPSQRCLLFSQPNFEPLFYFSSKVYKGEETTFQISGLQTNTDYRFRVCVCRRCLDTSQELSGPFSPSVAFMLQRSELLLAGETGRIDDPKTKSLMPSDEQFAALLVLGFASVSILFAFILQYLLMK